MKFIDLFAGIGGIRLGLEQSGHKCLGFCEYDKYAQTAYKSIYDTNGEWESHDIRATKPGDIPRADLWTGGFPCQDISAAGAQKGIEKGERSGLFYEIIRLLRGLPEEDRPEWLLLENVKNLLHVNRGFDFLRVLNELGDAGYSVEWQLLNSKDFGVPQNRERVFIVGHRGNGCARKVFPIFPEGGSNTVQCKKLTKGLGQALECYSSDGLSVCLKATTGGDGATSGLYSFIDLSFGNENQLTENARCLQARYSKGVSFRRGELSGICIINDKGKTKKQAPILNICPTIVATAYKGPPKFILPVLTPDREEKRQNGRRYKTDGEPMFTLTAQDRHGIAVGDTQHVYVRRLTPRECWRLQGFPDEYFDKAKAAGISDAQLYKQAGNAVTVTVARAIGQRLKELEGESQ